MSNIHRTQPPAPTPLEQNRAAWADEEAARARRRVKSLASLRSAASLATTMGWIVAACGIVVGFLAATSASDDGDSFAGGAALVIGSILFGAMVNLFGRWASAWAAHADR